MNLCFVNFRKKFCYLDYVIYAHTHKHTQTHMHTHTHVWLPRSPSGIKRDENHEVSIDHEETIHTSSLLDSIPLGRKRRLWEKRPVLLWGEQDWREPQRASAEGLERVCDDCAPNSDSSSRLGITACSALSNFSDRKPGHETLNEPILSQDMRGNTIERMGCSQMELPDTERWSSDFLTTLPLDVGRL